MCQYAEVIISIANKNVDKPFQYIVPQKYWHILKPGMRVLVPFGNGNKNIEGYVWNLTGECNFSPEKLKSINSVIDGYPIFTDEMLKLAEWMQKKYYTTTVDCLHCIMPAGIRLLKNSEFPAFRDYSINVQSAVLNEDNENLDQLIEEILAKPGKQSDVLQLVLSNGQVPINEIKAYLRISGSPIATLVKKGIIKIETHEIMRNIYGSGKYPKLEPPELTSEQKHAVTKINGLIKIGETPILLHGITGSGKTEVYMNIIENVINAGKQAIVLVPEISLTPQAVETFMCRFGDLVTVTHSKLSLGERFDQWKKAREGKISIMIGPRSAVFTPFSKLGVIVIDEEHEKTYKSEYAPKYDAKEVAEKRAGLTGCAVVFGSATPSIETYFKSVEHIEGKKNIPLVTLNERVNKKLPKSIVIDMRKELEEGNRSVFSNELYNALHENLNKKEQSILFLNRRGHSTFISCRRCGHVLQCRQCSVNYTYHMPLNRLTCHYCGSSEKPPEVCPVCASKHIKYFGIGTQKIEGEIKKAFPAASVLRMDMDTTLRKNSHEKIINEFSEGKADILIGTQMVAKGHNFPNVSLVGIIAADTALNTGDYSSAETAYQLIAQVSGRAGRAKLDGTVYIQTYNPAHYSIQFAKENDYTKFYEHEISLRRQMQYPPFTHFFVIMFTGLYEKPIIQALNKLLDIMNYYNKKGFFEMLGPAPAVISKIRKNYRWKLLVKGYDEELIKMFVFHCMAKLEGMGGLGGIKMNLTLNPPVIN